MPMMATPKSGDHFNCTGLFLEISRPPMSATFSLVKNLKEVATVNAKPIIKIIYPAVLMFSIRCNQCKISMSAGYDVIPC
jgi:hypothetical protein